MADLNSFLGEPLEPEKKATSPLDDFLGGPTTVEEAPKVEQFLAPLKGPAPEGVRDLTRDDVFDKIRPYMKSKFGMTEDKFERQEIVDAYVNHMRKFNFGQSVVTLGEMSYLNGATDAQKAEAAAAYQTFDSMKGAFAEGTSGMEKLDAVYDYGRALIVDPVNVLSLGVGKLVTGGGTKAAAQLAKEGVKRQVADIIKKQGLTQGAKQAAKQVERKIIGETLRSEAFKKASKGLAVKEALYTGAVDTVAGVSMDAVYQQAMQEVGLQTEYDLLQGSLAAAGGAFGTGLSMGLSMLGRSFDPDTDMLGAFYFDRANTDLARAREIAGDVSKAAKEKLDLRGFQDSLPEFQKNIEDFADKVERGELLRLLGTGQRVPKETQIRKAFYLGDEKLGFKGIADILADNGVRNWTKRTDSDNFSNWMHDLIREMPEEVQGQLDDIFRKTLGKAVPDYQGKSLLQALDMDAKEFSVAGQQLNILSQAARTLRYIPKVADDELLPELIKAELPPVSQRVREAFSEKTSYLQRNLIRMLVTHPGTTALNLIGWQTASTMQSMSDIVRGTLYGGNAILQTAMFNKEGAANYAKRAGLMFGLQKQKMRNLLDTHMTYEAFMDFAAFNPEAQKKMFRYLSGGIELEEVAKDIGFEDFGKMAKEIGVTDAEKLSQNEGLFSKAMDGLQTIYGVKAQDMLTKTQEFMYAIDKRIRAEYGVTYSEFIRDPNLWKNMQGDKYAQIVSESADDALRAVFAKPYGGTKGTLQFAAKIVEDIRKYPVVGAMVPFGQFFNNTLGHIMDHTGISLIHRYVAGTTRDPMELLTKSAVGLSFIGAAYTFEKDYLEEGLGLFQERSSDGTIRNRQYDFPYSFYKAIGRMAAYVVRDGEIPRATIEEVMSTFGPQQLTRQLGDSIQASYDMLIDIATSDDLETKRVLSEVVQKSAAMYISGYTRPLDPVNQVASLMKGDEYVSPDRRQGSEWVNNSLRYTDELLGAMQLYTKPEQKERALTSSKDRLPIGRIFGFREELAQTPIQQMFNEAGLAQWRTGIRSTIAEPLNDVNRIITPVLNYKAAELMDTNVWKSADAAERKQLISRVVAEAKKEIRDLLSTSFDPSDTRTSLLFKLGEGSFVSKKDLAGYLQDMGFDDDPSKLDIEQLQLLIGYIELDKEQEKETQQLLGLR